VNNVVINYVLPHQTLGDVFLDNVLTTNTAIFDEEGTLVMDTITSSAHHLSFKGIRIYLEPGNYRLVSWGNTGTNTTLRDVETHYIADQPNGYVTYDAIIDGMVDDSDLLFYAPNTVDTRADAGTGEGNSTGEFLLTVTEEGHNSTLNFRHAHRRVEIYVKNFDDGTGSITPDIRLTGLPRGLTFIGMKDIDLDDKITDDAHVSTVMPTESVRGTIGGQEGNYAFAPFHSFFFNVDEQFEMEEEEIIYVNVVNPRTGATVYTTPLRDHIPYGQDNPDSNQPIMLLVEFLGNTEVSVTIPDWDEIDVGHGITFD
jgi:hypothetical protein